ncbi:MAG: hypothetical protein LC745_12340 [Planctomycetia bacterium]|nr:hypothetical protein [Planctomycetia bacterium]
MPPPAAELVDPDDFDAPTVRRSRREARAAVKWATIQLALVLFPAALLLDGGQAFRACAVAGLTSWATTAMILVRRGGSLTRPDLLVIRYGFWFFLALVVALAPFVHELIRLWK